MTSIEASRSDWVDVCRVDRLLPDRGACALVGGEQVAIFRLGVTDEVFAISNYDPFSRAFVLSRGIVGTKGDVVKVASPIYKQTFDLRTGACLEKPEVRIPTYGVRVVGCVVQVQLSARSIIPRSNEVGPTRGSPPTTPLPTANVSERRAGPLAGFRVAVCEFREQDRLAHLLESQGADVLSCPLVASTEADDPAAVERWLQDLVDGVIQACVFFTGEGVARILGVADTIGMRPALLAALSKVVTVTRGPKPARVLREAGILPTHPADVPTAQGVLDALRSLDLGQATIGVQLYPRPTSGKRIVQQLKNEGFCVREVWPYKYAPVSDERTFRELTTRLVSGNIDVIVFTSRAQVDALYVAAARVDLRSAVEAGLLRTRIAAVGPVVAATLRSHGLRPSIVPADLFFMKSLVKEIVAASRATSAA